MEACPLMQHDEAVMRYSTAKGYLQACKMIFTSQHYCGSNIIAAVLPLHMLAAFALELYLKAWLLRAGVNSKEVRCFGHKIADLYESAKGRDLPTSHRLSELVSHFASPHADFTYRYIESYTKLDDTNWLLAFKVLEDLDRDVDVYLGASAAYGLEPGH